MSGRTGSRRSPAAVAGLGHHVIDRTIGLTEVGAGDDRSSARRRDRDRRSGLRTAGARGDRRAREAGGMPGDRAPRRPGRRVHPGGGQARDLRLHRRRRRSAGAPELDRHRAAAVRRVSRPGGGVRASRGDRAGEGHPDGAPSVDERDAFNMLRDHARRTNRKMVDVAEEIVSTHRLLPGARPGAAGSTETPGSSALPRVGVEGDRAPALPGASRRSSIARVPRRVGRSRGSRGSVGDDEAQAIGPHGLVLDAGEAHDIWRTAVAAFTPVLVHRVLGTELVVRLLDPFVRLTRSRLVDGFLATVVTHGEGRSGHER